MDRFLYFAYGSNMLLRRLAARTPSAERHGVGYVEGHCRTFDKVSKDGSGKCHIEPAASRSEQVYGVLFSIDRGEEVNLDRAEGFGRGYEKKMVVAHCSGQTLEATTYYATSRDPDVLPYHWYKRLVVSGAEENCLPADEIKRLAAVPSKDDPDPQREVKEMAIL